MTQMLLDIAPDWQPTLDNFVVGRNVELLSALRHALAGTASERCFYLWGDSGSGKSHLLQAVVEESRKLGQPAIYVHGAATEGMLEVARTVSVDNVDTLDDATQVALFTLYNHMRDSGGLLLVSGEDAPANLSLRDDLRTRLGWGLVYQLHSLNDVEKAQALERHAHARGFTLPPEVTQYLLRHGRRDLPALLALLDKLDAHSLRMQRAPSVPLLKEVMQTT